MILHTLEYLSFAQRDPAGVKTVLAQFFSLDSEGFVFKGKKALIDETNAPHVSKNEAEMHACIVFTQKPSRSCLIFGKFR